MQGSRYCGGSKTLRSKALEYVADGGRITGRAANAAGREERPVT